MARDPRIINESGKAPDWSQWKPASVEKIVLGNLDGEPQNLGALPEGFGSQYSNLTHLHLWGLKGLCSFPSLPPSLKCLDVRNCPDLAKVPELPPELETLDLGRCAALKKLRVARLPKLQRLYLDGCTNLDPDDLEAFFRDNQDAPLEELDASACPAFTKLKNVPPSKLRKLVLKDCTQFADASGIDHFSNLDHLNLSGCLALRSLPDLPHKARYVLLHGAQSLERFLDQDIGTYDRGSENENVAGNLKSRQKFGSELGLSAHAKLLLMGDGRVGKTTLAKRLMWDTLSPQQRAAHPELKPVKGEPFTDKVRFWKWETELQLTPEQGSSLNQRAISRKLKRFCDAKNRVPGTIRMLDFGGQEIYHQTHRIFASEGTVFLLVWRAEEPDWKEIEKENPSGVDPSQWREWNRQRSLEYWIDYIDSLRSGARIALVCSFCPAKAKREPWEERLGKHADRKDLECFYVDSLEEECLSSPEYRKLVEWVQRECGEEAARIGILQPRFYSGVAAQVDQMLAENQKARDSVTEPLKHLIFDWTDWEAVLRKQHGRTPSGLQLEDGDIKTITGYLHDAGQIFRISYRKRTAVLVDLIWAADLLYALLRPGSDLTKVISKNGGWFTQPALEQSPDWRLLSDDLHRERLIAYMEECHLVARVSEAGENRLGKTLFVATEKWLLPSYEKVESDVDSLMQKVRSLPRMTAKEAFRFEETPISEFDFRSLLAYLAQFFGRQAIWFQDGLVAADNRLDPQSWCFRVRWRPINREGLMGNLDAVLVTRSHDLESLGRQMEALFAGENCPVRSLRKPVRREAKEEELEHAFFRERRGDDYDVALSSSGADRQFAEKLWRQLKGRDLRVVWYQDEDYRSGDHAKLMNFMRCLSIPPVMVLLLSDGYLSADVENNWYCLWELADAVKCMANGRRKLQQTVVIYLKGERVSSRTLHEVARQLFDKAAEHFWKLYSGKGARESEEFNYYNELKEHFSTAIDGLGAFFQERGNLGCYTHVPGNPDGTLDIEEVLKRVRDGLAAARGTGSS